MHDAGLFKITPLLHSDKEKIRRIIENTGVFNIYEINVALELIDSALARNEGDDYRIYCHRIENDVITGYICFGPIPMTQQCFDIYWIAVDTKMKRHHIGTKLLEFAESEIESEGGRKIFIDTSSTPPYEAARSLYAKSGYIPVATFEDFYRPGDDKIVFMKDLKKNSRLFCVSEFLSTCTNY